MTLRRRMLWSFALVLLVVIPVALWVDYRENEDLYRDFMGHQAGYVAELLKEKVAEPLDDIADLSRDKGLAGHWEAARLDGEMDGAATWIEDGGRRVAVPLKMLLQKLQEVPLISSRYAFMMDNSGSTLLCLPDGTVVFKSAGADYARRVFPLGQSRLKLLSINDPLHGKPAFLVLVVIPQVELAVGVISPRQDLDDQLTSLTATILQLACAMLLAGIVLSYFAARSVTAPLEDLTRAVRRSVRGELDVPLQLSPIREVGQLGEAFNKMRQDLAEYLEQLRRTTAENARVAHELELARSIQGNADVEVASGAWTVTGKSEPAREVGGDVMDVFELPEGKIGMLVGDVSGKGIPAALHTLLARASLKHGLTQGGSPAGALALANGLLALDNHDSVFVSALVAVLDPARSELTWARAGHPAPLSADGSLEGPNGPPLGLVEGLGFTDHTRILAEGSYLLYTDGFSEAENLAGEFLTSEPLRRELSTPEADVWARLRQHREAAEPSDDATAILLCRKPGEEPV
jgi:sigma-B regulation protein RsbU (phosphoserine phosphatase)